MNAAFSRSIIESYVSKGYWTTRSFIEHPCHAARDRGDQPVLICHRRSLGYRQLVDHVEKRTPQFA